MKLIYCRNKWEGGGNNGLFNRIFGDELIVPLKKVLTVKFV